jgi:hypothetical protein
MVVMAVLLRVAPSMVVPWKDELTVGTRVGSSTAIVRWRVIG